MENFPWPRTYSVNGENCTRVSADALIIIIPVSELADTEARARSPAELPKRATPNLCVTSKHVIRRFDTIS